MKQFNMICISLFLFCLNFTTSLKMQLTSSNFLNSRLSQLTEKFQLTCRESKVSILSNPSLTLESSYHEEVKGSKLSGVLCHHLQTIDYKVDFLSIWCGPSIPNPHFQMELHISNDLKYGKLLLDYIPRGMTPLGSDGNYLQLYYQNKDILSQRDSIIQYCIPSQCNKNNKNTNFYSRLIASPNLINISFDMQQVSIELIHKEIDMFLDRWLSWIALNNVVDPRQRSLFNTRDDRQRQYFYASNLIEMEKLVSKEDAKELGTSLIQSNDLIIVCYCYCYL